MRRGSAPRIDIARARAPADRASFCVCSNCSWAAQRPPHASCATAKARPPGGPAGRANNDCNGCDLWHIRRTRALNKNAALSGHAQWAMPQTASMGASRSGDGADMARMVSVALPPNAHPSPACGQRRPAIAWRAEHPQNVAKALPCHMASPTRHRFGSLATRVAVAHALKSLRRHVITTCGETWRLAARTRDVCCGTASSPGWRSSRSQPLHLPGGLHLSSNGLS